MRAKATKSLAAFTLLEMMVSVIVLSVLISFSVPRFRKAFEQARVDLATANLQAIWTAQRLYKVQNGAFAQNISPELDDYLDPAFVANLNNAKASFLYYISTGTYTPTTFDAQAVRNPNLTSFWYGYVDLDQAGMLVGGIRNADGDLVTPVSTF